MSKVSDIGRQQSSQFLLQLLRGKLDDTQRTISSGKKSDNLGGLGSQGVANAINFRSKVNVLQGYSNNLNLAKSKLSVMDKTLGSIAESGRDTLNFLRSQLQNTTPQAIIVSSQASSKLSDALSVMNTQVNGQYQFSGDDLYNPPMASPSALDTNVGGLVPGFLAGSPTVSSVMAAARGVTNTNLGFSSTLSTAGNVSFRADDNQDIDYTVKADQAGFADVMRGMALVKNLPQPTTAAEQANYWTVVNAAISLIDSGTKEIDQYQGSLGNKAKQVDNLLAQHSETTGQYEIFIGDVEDADVAKASVDLQSLQTQLQASYSIIAQLKNLSLVNFLN